MISLYLSNFISLQKILPLCENFYQKPNDKYYGVIFFSNITLDSLDKWDRYDDVEENFCDLDGMSV